MENVIIIGSGPAAYCAALFTKDVNPIMFEGLFVNGIGAGGQLTTTTDVDNYPGFPQGVQGPDLMENMREQALKNNIKIFTENVIKVEKVGEIFSVSSNKREFKTRSVIIATGASAKRLYVPGTNDNEFWQKGISACAVCDGYFFKDKIVAVIGGGDSAMEETEYLSKIASKVYLIHRRNEFRARNDKLEKIKSIPNIEIITPAELVSANGNKFLESLKLKNNESGEIFDIKVDGLFFGIGHNPNVEFLNGLVKVDENNYIVTDKSMKTSVSGIFACGDVQDHIYRQAITAAASGCVAAKECLNYLKN